MKDQNGRLQKFNRTNLFNTIRAMVDIDNSILRNDLKQYIWPRLDFCMVEEEMNDISFLRKIT